MAEKSFRLRVSTAVGTPELQYEEVLGKKEKSTFEDISWLAAGSKSCKVWF